MSTAEDIIQDKQIGHSIYMTRYGTGLSNRFEKDLNEGFNKALANYIMKDPATKRGLATANKTAHDILKETYKDLKSSYTDEMREYINYELTYQYNNTKGLAGVELKLIDNTAVTGIIKETPIGNYETMSSWFSSASLSSYNNIVSTINRGWDEGKTIDQLVRDLKGTKTLGYKDGLLQTSRNNARAFVKTSLKSMETQTQTELWKANPDIVKKYKWVSVLDSRTSLICQSRDGRIYEVGKGDLPPAHPNCRSSVTPVFDSNAKQSEDARYSISGKQPSGTTYREFLKRQPAWFQKEVLGKSRYEAFKKDSNSIDKFVSPAGGIYTVKELQTKGVL